MPSTVDLIRVDHFMKNENNSALDSWKQISDGIYVPSAQQFKGALVIGSSQIQELKLRAQNSPRKRARICAHADSKQALHQMILVIQRESYVQPHRHLNKIESFHLIEGQMDVVIFADDGKILEIIQLCAYPETQGSVLYRLDHSFYHTVVVHSSYVVFHEITQGPFEKDKTDYAPWAPDETQLDSAKAWLEDLKKECRYGILS